jgi:hypothetical protein
MIELEACVAKESWVNKEYRMGLSMHRCGARVEDQRSGDVVSYLHYLGAAYQVVQDPVAQGGVQTQGLKLNDELGVYYGVDC